MAQVFAILLSLLRLSIWLAILAVIFVPLEHFFAVSSHKAPRKGLGADLCYYFLNSLVPAALLSIPAALLGWLAVHVIPGKVIAFTTSLPYWAQAVLALIAGEVGYYWGHRWTHQVPFLWRFHSIHHSAEEVDFLVNTRAHPLDMVFSRMCGLVPIYALGLGAPTARGSELPILVTLVGTLWGFFIHANLKWNLGPLEWVISTPKFHHWHHTKTGLIDHNYSSTLPWIDRIFGTHNLPKEWPESYGIEAKLPSNVIDQLLYPILPDEAPAPAPAARPAAEPSVRPAEESE